MSGRALVTALLVGLLASCLGEAPPVIRSEMDATAPGKATVVLFVDFECPYCKKAHASLERALEGREDRVRLVLRHVPLRMHPLARPAARVAVCAERFRVPPARIADALYRATDLGEPGVAHAAEELGLSRGAVEACAAEPRTEARLESDRRAFEAVGGDGVPLVFIGKERFDGARPASELRAALDVALSGH